MTGSVAASLVRRGVQAAHEFQNGRPSNDQPDELQQEIIRRLRSPSTIIALGLTLVAFFLLTTAIEYAIRIVACNLAIAEDTQGGSSVRLPASNDPDAPLEKESLLDVDEIEKQDYPSIPSQPITRKLRTTFKHLSSVGGFRARFRGLQYLALYSLMGAGLNALFRMGLRFLPGGRIIGVVLAGIITARVHAAWTHATIAAPSNKSFCQRFLPKTSSKHLLLPTIRLIAAHEFSKFMVCGAGMYSQRKMQLRTDDSIAKNLPLVLLPIMVAIFAGLAILLPSHIALIRVEASLLPEDESAIVPLDRTFGGKVVHATAPSRKIYVLRNLTIKGAWMTFDRETFRRVFKLHVKMMVILTAITVAFAHLLAFELYVIFGDLIPKVLPYIEAARQGMH